MLLSAVYVLVVAQSSSEIREGLMDNPALSFVSLLAIFAETTKSFILFGILRLYSENV
jgi:hypothetical protein